MLLAGVYVCSFQPGNFTAWGNEGVNLVEHLTEKARRNTD